MIYDSHLRYAGSVEKVLWDRKIYISLFLCYYRENDPKFITLNDYFSEKKSLDILVRIENPTFLA